MSPVTCPSAERLRALLDGILSADETATLTGHLDSCANCRNALERLAGGTGSWGAMRGMLGSEAEPASPALNAALADVREAADPQPTRTTPPPDADATRTSAGAAPGGEDREDLPPSVGPYRIEGLIGEGGMGRVVKGFDASLHRVVAIKLMAGQLAANRTARHRFMREAKAAAAVAHEHIVTIHEIGEQNGTPYIVMQFVKGKSLQDRLNEAGPLTLREVLRIGMQVASGLAAAHAQGIVHRDIKPSNILLENGVERVKITDFGLARVNDDAVVTSTGVIAGTPAYMSPEQATGDPMDHRSDLFSLGSVLYAMCTGEPPFLASNPLAAMKRVCEKDPRPVRELNPDMPDWLGGIIGKLLAKDPRERFQSAAEVAELLGRHLAHLNQPTVVPPPADAAPDIPPQRYHSPAPNHPAKPLPAISLPQVLLAGGYAGAFALTLLYHWLGGVSGGLDDHWVIDYLIFTFVAVICAFAGELLPPYRGAPPRYDYSWFPVLIAAIYLTFLAGAVAVQERQKMFDGYWLYDLFILEACAVAVSLWFTIRPFALHQRPDGAPPAHGKQEALLWLACSVVVFACLAIILYIGEQRGGNWRRDSYAAWVGMVLHLLFGGCWVLSPRSRWHPSPPRVPTEASATRSKRGSDGLGWLAYLGLIPLVPLGLWIFEDQKWPILPLLAVGLAFLVGFIWLLCRPPFTAKSRVPAEPRPEVPSKPLPSDDPIIFVFILVVTAAVVLGLGRLIFPIGFCILLAGLALVVLIALKVTRDQARARALRPRPTPPPASEGPRRTRRAPAEAIVAMVVVILVLGLGIGMVMRETLFRGGASGTTGIGKKDGITKRIREVQVQFICTDPEVSIAVKGEHFGLTQKSLPRDGRLNMRLPAGAYAVTALKEGQATYETHIGLSESEDLRTIKIPATGWVRIVNVPGMTVRLDGNVIAGPDDAGAEREVNAGTHRIVTRAAKDSTFQNVEFFLKAGTNFDFEARPAPDLKKVERPNAFALQADPLAGSPWRHFSTLEEAVFAADTGSLIEVRDPGPFSCEHMSILRKRLTIRAATEEQRPVIRMGQASVNRNNALLDVTAGDLTLEGIELHVHGSRRKLDAQPMPMLVRVVTGGLRIANCKFVVTGYAEAVTSVHGARCEVRNSMFICGVGADRALSWVAPGEGQLVVDNCLFVDGGIRLGTTGMRPDPKRHLAVDLTRNTFTADYPIIVERLADLKADALGPPGQIRIWLTENIIDAQKAFLAVGEGRELAQLKPDETEAFVRHLIHWEEHENIYSTTNTFLAGVRGNETYGLPGSPTNPEEWQAYWKFNDPSSNHARVQFEKDLRSGRPELGGRLERLEPEDYSLRAKSPGKKTGDGRPDLGINPSLVGPGKAYETWKKTPSYDAWKGGRLADAGTITGRVRDELQLVGEGKLVELVDEKEALVATTLTLEGGTFTFEAVKPGRYTVLAKSGRGGTMAELVTVERNKTVEIELNKADQRP